jgi:hypothetical protein
MVLIYFILFPTVLVRVLMVRSAGRADPMPNATVLPNFSNNLHSFRVKDYVSSFNFFNDVGTHYISSYLTGNSIYQVNYICTSFIHTLFFQYILQPA